MKCVDVKDKTPGVFQEEVNFDETKVMPEIRLKQRQSRGSDLLPLDPGIKAGRQKRWRTGHAFEPSPQSSTSTSSIDLIYDLSSSHSFFCLDNRIPATSWLQRLPYYHRVICTDLAKVKLRKQKSSKRNLRPSILYSSLSLQAIIDPQLIQVLPCRQLKIGKGDRRKLGLSDHVENRGTMTFRSHALQAPSSHSGVKAGASLYAMFPSSA